MWEGLTGKRRKNGLFGMIIGIVVSSILLYLSFSVSSFLYLLIPILLLVIFHYTKTWRFSDRAVYGFIAIILAFFIAMGGISTSIEGAPHQSTATLTELSVPYYIHFGYYNNSGSYIFNFSLPAKNISNTAQIGLIDLFTNETILSTNATFTNSANNYSYSWNAGQLSSRAYVVLLTLHFMENNTTVNQEVEFLGPVLISGLSVTFYLVERLIATYLLITFLFFLAFAFFARALSMSRQRRNTDGNQNPPKPTEQPVMESDQRKTGWFGRRKN